MATLRAIALAMISTAAFAGNLSFLTGAPISRFTDEDVSLMTQNAEQVLDSESPVAKHEWSNPRTGAAGFAEARGHFTATNGRLCKRLRVSNRAKGIATASEATYTICKHEDRGWTLDPSATAKPPAP